MKEKPVWVIGSKVDWSELNKSDKKVKISAIMGEVFSESTAAGLEFYRCNALNVPDEKGSCPMAGGTCSSKNNANRSVPDLLLNRKN